MKKKLSTQNLKKILILVLLTCCIIHCKDQKNNTNDSLPTKDQKAVKLTFQPQDFNKKTEDTATPIPPQQSIKFPKYKRIYNSSQYHLQFASQLSKIPSSQTVNATYISNGKQLCLKNVGCQFYYYVINPIEGNNTLDMNVKNILFVAGMHGNEYLGPISLLYAIKHLQTASTRIIIFPLANPSGFDLHRRTTFPTNLDPNRDFPIQQYTQCYQTSSSLIIDHIYRKYPIHLTLALHNGNSQIGWNWGTVRQRFNSKTDDEVIYRDIGEWLQFAGGRNKEIKMKDFKIGTMDDAVYPVEGGFQDWAYAASWYNASLGVKPSIKCPFSQYPNNMTTGLVFLFELGPFDVDEKEFGSQEGLYINPTSRDKSNGYISRAIRMYMGLMKILNPKLNLKFTNQNIILSLQGCKNGILNKFIISNKSNSTQVYYSSKEKYNILGGLNNKTIQPTVLQLEKRFFTDAEISQRKFEKLQGKNLIVEYELVCDPQWEGRGRSIFGHKRQFHVKQSLLLTPKPTLTSEQTLFPTLPQALSSISNNKKSPNSQTQDDNQPIYNDFIQNNSDTLMIIIILILALTVTLCIIWLICKSIRRDMKARRIQRLKRKLQRINHQASVQQIAPYKSTEITLSNTTNQNDNSVNNKTNKKNVESYPHMCESDKSMKTQQLKQQFIKLSHQFSQIRK